MLLFAPLLYISGMLLYMGSLGFDVSIERIGRRGGGPQRPGSVYRSPQVFESLWPLMEADRNETHNAVTSFSRLASVICLILEAFGDIHYAVMED